MGCARRIAATCALALLGPIAHAQPTAPSPTAEQAVAPPRADEGKLFAETLEAYHAALRARRLGQQELRKEDVVARVAEGEELMTSGRVDEAIARLVELVESAQFDLYAESDAGRAAVYRLGDALAEAHIFGPARAYLRRTIDAKGSWEGNSPWARRAVRRLVDVALESEEYAAAERDLASVPHNAPEEVRGEIAYLSGRAQEAAG